MRESWVLIGRWLEWRENGDGECWVVVDGRRIDIGEEEEEER